MHGAGAGPGHRPETPAKGTRGLSVTWVQLALRLRISKAQPVVLPQQDLQGCRSAPLPRGSFLWKPVKENYVLFLKKGFSRKKYGSVELDIFMFQVCATPSGLRNSLAGASVGSKDMHKDHRTTVWVRGPPKVTLSNAKSRRERGGLGIKAVGDYGCLCLFSFPSKDFCSPCSPYDRDSCFTAANHKAFI